MLSLSWCMITVYTVKNSRYFYNYIFNYRKLAQNLTLKLYDRYIINILKKDFILLETTSIQAQESRT